MLLKTHLCFSKIQLCILPTDFHSHPLLSTQMKLNVPSQYVWQMYLNRHICTKNIIYTHLHTYINNSVSQIFFQQNLTI